MNNFVQRKGAVTRIAPDAGIAAGCGRRIGSEFHVAITSALAGQQYSAQLTGIIALPVADDETGVQGGVVYWGDSDCKCYASSGDGERYAIGTISAVKSGAWEVALFGEARAPISVPAELPPQPIGEDIYLPFALFVNMSAGTTGAPADEQIIDGLSAPMFLMSAQVHVTTGVSTDGKIQLRTKANGEGDLVHEFNAAATAAGAVQQVVLGTELASDAALYLYRSDAAIAGNVIILLGENKA